VDQHGVRRDWRKHVVAEQKINGANEVEEWRQRAGANGLMDVSNGRFVGKTIWATDTRAGIGAGALSDQQLRCVAETLGITSILRTSWGI